MDFKLLFQTILSGLISGSIYGVLGLGFVVTYKATRVLNLARRLGGASPPVKEMRDEQNEACDENNVK